MNNKSAIWIIAGLLNLFTALLHTIGGQLDLVNPLLKSNLNEQVQTEWLGVWHMVTIVLFVTSYYLLRCGFSKNKSNNFGVIQSIGIIYILFSLPFVFAGIFMQNFAPQWILLLPIGGLTIFGLNRNIKLNKKDEN